MRGRKGGRGRSSWALYRWPWRGEGVRVRAGLHRAAGRHRAGEGQRPGEKGGPDRWAPPVGGRRRRADTLSGRRDSGPGPNSGLG
jgi:hypothetical protein